MLASANRGPTLRRLFGPSSFTLLVGLCTCGLHACGFLAASRGVDGWWLPPLLGYTLGSVCRMYQLVVAGEVRRRLVLHPECLEVWTRRLPLVTSNAVHGLLLRLVLLPSLCNDGYEYHANHYQQHHDSLGGSSLAESMQEYMKSGRGFDGDMILAGTWMMRSRLKEDLTVRNFYKGTNLVISSFKMLLGSPMLILGRYSMMLSWNLMCFVIIPFGGVCALGFLYELTCRSTMRTRFEKEVPSSRQKELFANTRRFLTMTSLGLQVLLAAAVNMALLGYWGPLAWLGLVGPAVADGASEGFFGSWGPSICAAAQGLLYLAVSELCAGGFLWHPYLAYYLTAHRSVPRHGQEEAGVDGEGVCRQPTMSCYSRPAAYATGFLSYHVEHHDFPEVPWHRLPEVTKAAPEFYERLSVANSFWPGVLLDYRDNGDTWVHASQDEFGMATGAGAAAGGG